MSKTVVVNQTHACGAGCGCGKANAGNTKVNLAKLVTDVAAVVEQVKRVCAPSLAQQVEQEIEKHPGACALLNEQTGKVATFMAPVPYFQLTPELRTALEAERQALIESLPRLNWTERIRASSRIRAIEGDLSRDRSGRESVRRDVERENERKRQRYGGE